MHYEKSKCVCAPFVLTEKEIEMTRKFKTVIVACIAMGCVLIGCKETNDDEENVNSTFCQQEQGTTDANKNVEQKESGIEEILNMTYSELVATEKTLTLSYYEGGGSPVYAVEEYEGVYIVYPAVSDEPQMNNLAESISDEIPVKLVIRSSETEIHPGLRVGMPAEKVNNLNIAWDDIYMSSENSLYYTSFKRDENEVTAAWAIPDDMFSEWSASLNDEDDYYAKFLEFIQPFKSEPVGTIVELSVKKSLDVKETVGDVEWREHTFNYSKNDVSGYLLMIIPSTWEENEGGNTFSEKLTYSSGFTASRKRLEIRRRTGLTEEIWTSDFDDSSYYKNGPFTGVTEKGYKYTYFYREPQIEKDVNWRIYYFYVSSGEGIVYTISIHHNLDVDSDNYLEMVIIPSIESVTIE